METEEVRQLVETIKTLNINFNDATTQKIADAIIPVVDKLIWLRVFEDILVFVGFVGVISLTVVAIYKSIKNN